MMSAIINVRDVNNELVEARALLDTCSTAHFITENFAKRLKIPTSGCTIPVNAINGALTHAKNRIEIQFHSKYNDYKRRLTCLTIDEISNSVPDVTFPRELVKIPANLRLADPQFHVSRPVDILIGSGTTLSMLSVGQINLSKNGCDLILQKTRLG